MTEESISSLEVDWNHYLDQQSPSLLQLTVYRLLGFDSLLRHQIPWNIETRRTPWPAVNCLGWSVCPKVCLPPDRSSRLPLLPTVLLILDPDGRQFTRL